MQRRMVKIKRLYLMKILINVIKSACIFKNIKGVQYIAHPLRLYLFL